MTSLREESRDYWGFPALDAMLQDGVRVALGHGHGTWCGSSWARA